MSEELLVGATWSCPTQDLVTALSTLAAVGFREVEVWADGIHLDPRVGPDVTAVRGRLDAHAVTVRSVHLPFDQVLPDAGADERAEEWVDLCARTLDHAQLLGAELAVLHPVLFSAAADDRAVVVDRFVATADAVAAHAAGLGIGLCLENMHTMRGPTLRSVAELREVLGRMSGRAGICLDTGHAVFNGFAGDAFAGEIRAAGALLWNTHVHDSDAVGRDPHLVPGDGLVPWPATSAAYRDVSYRGGYVVEVKGGDDPVATLTRACANLRAAFVRDPVR